MLSNATNYNKNITFVSDLGTNEDWPKTPAKSPGFSIKSKRPPQIQDYAPTLFLKIKKFDLWVAQRIEKYWRSMGFLQMGRFKKLCSSQEMKVLRLKITLKWVIELGFELWTLTWVLGDLLVLLKILIWIKTRSAHSKVVSKFRTSIVCSFFQGNNIKVPICFCFFH